ncbi:hypothetical protein EC9_39210 [Rosistilla ulvae]|uniref:Uncharacterized protein n=1 Tax=Rosistilla ulvae TaxID=1930277 RepID=A0A517M4C3_9BACT|nr:hypothetical protein EC9_39210 [Rosistilla ulvae]
MSLSAASCCSQLTLLKLSKAAVLPAAAIANRDGSPSDSLGWEKIAAGGNSLPAATIQRQANVF